MGGRVETASGLGTAKRVNNALGPLARPAFVVGACTTQNTFVILFHKIVMRPPER